MKFFVFLAGLYSTNLLKDLATLVLKFIKPMWYSDIFWILIVKLKHEPKKLRIFWRGSHKHKFFSWITNSDTIHESKTLNCLTILDQQFQGKMLSFHVVLTKNCGAYGVINSIALIFTSAPSSHLYFSIILSPIISKF